MKHLSPVSDFIQTNNVFSIIVALLITGASFATMYYSLDKKIELVIQKQDALIAMFENFARESKTDRQDIHNQVSALRIDTAVLYQCTKCK